MRLTNVLIMLGIVAFCFCLVADSPGDPQLAAATMSAEMSALRGAIATLPSPPEEPLALPMPPEPPKVPAVKRNAPEPPASRPERKHRDVVAVVTAYCPCALCCNRETGLTSIGRSAWRRGVAADPQALPYGTRLDVPGYGESVVDDTGSAVRNAWAAGWLELDVRMKYHWVARKWGRKQVVVRVYE